MGRSKSGVKRTTVLRAESYFGGECIVAFSGTGYKVLQDTRKVKDGYLHLYSESAEKITRSCRDQILKYMFNVPSGLPGIGKTVQDKYFKGVSLEEAKAIARVKKVYLNK